MTLVKMKNKSKNKDKNQVENNIECKFCKKPVDLNKMKVLPKKFISERYGLYWTGLEKVFLLIYKVNCPSCKKKYSHKKFISKYLYK